MTDRTVVYRLRADAQQFQAQMKAAAASVQDAAGKMTSADKEGQKFRKGLDTLGTSAGKVGLVAAVGLGAAIKKAADFDQAMSKVSAATGETAANMDKLRQAALDAGAQTVFSATEAADGIEQLAKAGVSTEAILSGGLKGALDLAAAGEMAVGDAAEVAAKAMAQFGLDGADVPHIADLLASAAGNASGEVSDFGMALSQSGLVANQVGLSLEETTAGLAAFAEAGLQGSDAGTSLKTMLGALTPNSNKAAKQMEALGLSAYDSQGNFIGLAEFAGKLQSSLSGMSDEQRQATMETIFGSDAVRAASVLYEQGEDGIRKWTSTVDDQGAAAEMAGKRLDNLKGDLEALGGAFETALIGTGDGSQGALRSLTQNLTDAVNAYNGLGDGAKQGVAVTLAATAGLGGGLFVFSRMVQSIAATREAMEALGLSATKTKGLVATAGKGMGIALAAGLAVAAGDLFDVDYSLDQINRQLELLAAQGDAKGVLEGLSMSADTLGEALRDAAFNDFNMFGMGAAQEIEELDAALAGLDPTVAAETFKVLVDEGKAAGLSVGEVTDLFPQYAAELKLAAKEAKAGAGANEAVADSSQKVAAATRRSAAQLAAQKEALQEARKAANDTARGFVNLGDGVDDAKVSLGQWITDMANQADALNNFMNNAKQASKRGLRDGLIKDLQDAGPAGALRMKQLANATDEEIARANRAWKRGQDAIRDYVNFKVPPKKPRVDIGPALAGIAALEARLRAIADEDVFINVRHRNGANTSGFGPQSNAEGGFITGPGTATSDSIPSYLSNGEYVIKAAAVDKYGVHMFDRLNAMHFADGGEVKKGDDKKRRRKFNGAEYVADNSGALQRSIDRLSMIAEDQTGAVENQTRVAEEAADETKRWADKMGEVAQATTAGFNSGLFDKDSNPWAAGAGAGPLANLTKDIAGLGERNGLQQQLAGMGLTGDALAALLAQGSNADIAGLINSGQVSQYASLFGQRAALQGSVGAAAGQQAYGAQLAAANQNEQAQRIELQKQTAQLQTLTTQVMHLQTVMENAPEATGDSVGRVINGGAAAAQRQRSARGGPR